MAASLSRPDPSSPAAVAEAAFSTARRGYHPDEVRAFLVSVAAELGRLQERERQLAARLDEMERTSSGSPVLDEETVAEMLGEETVRVLQTARESASQIRIRAEEAAARVLREASDEANRLRRESEVDSAKRRQDASAEAESEVALAKQQGREMVNEARAYRERVLADLERRTRLARNQIEELMQGRDRLLQVFERARLVAVDITTELKAVDTPDEVVNLAPTTGPVPIMVPQQKRPAPDPVDESPEPETRVDSRSVERPAAVDAVGPVVDDEADVDGVDDATVADEVGSDDASADTDADVDAMVEDGSVDVDADAPVVGDEPTPDPADAEAGAEERTLDSADAEAGAEEPTAARRDDTNVVSLFRSRHVVVELDDDDEPAGEPDGAADPAVAPVTEDTPTDDTTDDTPVDAVEDTSDAPGGAEERTPASDGDDVGGIFARLRHELPTHETVETVRPATATATAADAPGTVETPFTRRDEALVPLIVLGARKLKRVLADEQNGALDRLRQRARVEQLDDLVGAADAHARSYVAAIEDELAAAAASGAVELGASDTTMLRRRMADAGALDEAAALLGASLVAPLRDRLDRALSDGAGDHDDIAQRIRAVYREWKTQRIDRHLDDVFRYAHGGGLIISAEPGTPLTWTLDPSEPACPDCEDNSLSGAVPSGQPFPTGHLAAPAHPGCRCLVLPDR